MRDSEGEGKDLGSGGGGGGRRHGQGVAMAGRSEQRARGVRREDAEACERGKGRADKSVPRCPFKVAFAGSTSAIPWPR